MKFQSDDVVIEHDSSEAGSDDDDSHIQHLKAKRGELTRKREERERDRDSKNVSISLSIDKSTGNFV